MRIIGVLTRVKNVIQELPTENPDNSLTTLVRGKIRRDFTTMSGGCVARHFAARQAGKSEGKKSTRWDGVYSACYPRHVQVAEYDTARDRTRMFVFATCFESTRYGIAN